MIIRLLTANELSLSMINLLKNNINKTYFSKKFLYVIILNHFEKNINKLRLIKM